MTAVVIFLLTFGIASVVLSVASTQAQNYYSINLRHCVLGLVGVIVLLEIYTGHQQWQIQRMQRRSRSTDELFRLIGQSASDMIAVVDVDGRRLYNSPSYQRVLGYSLEELRSTSTLDQIHPDDRSMVAAAAEEARRTGIGKRLQYRIRHKDGSWRYLESNASAIRNPEGDVEKLVIVNRDITDRKLAEQQLQYSAFHDHLTNLPNRALFVDRLQHAFDYARRHSDYKFALLFVDVDGLKAVNDTMGHSAGDQLIIEIAGRLAACVRREDTIARSAASESNEGSLPSPSILSRLGGDEFTILLNDIDNPADSLRVANRIRERLSSAVILQGQEVFTSVSIGVALSVMPHGKAEELLQEADIAMYRAKALGKSRCEVFDKEMHTQAVARLKLEADLRHAVNRREFVVHYQPIVSLQSGRIAGFEALVRWQHPQEGLLYPDKFISVAEDIGVISDIGKGVLEESCRQARAWQLQCSADPPLSITVNVSPKQFTQSDLVSDVRVALQKSGLNPNNLQLEITESTVMSDPETTGDILSGLRALGVRICIDDFGTGYSSLSRLDDFPVNVLKIDRSFLLKMAQTNDSKVVRLILALAHNLNLKVIAEGIEHTAQLQDLRELGCEFGQGYLFSKPVPKDVATTLLAGDCDFETHSTVGRRV